MALVLPGEVNVQGGIKHGIITSDAADYGRIIRQATDTAITITASTTTDVDTVDVTTPADHPNIGLSNNGAWGTIEWMWSAGGQAKGTLWGRDQDVLGVAVGQVIPSRDMTDSTTRKAKEEGHFEAYYNFYVNRYLALTPGIQFIWNPYGGDSESDAMIAVYSLRSHVDF